MSELKCPFCQDTLIPCIKNQNDWIYHCDNQKCPMYDDADNENAKHLLASKDLWQELIRTRKALKIAVDALKEINDRYESEEQRGREEDDSPDWWDFAMDTGEILAKALDQITALEQKDAK